MFLLCEMMRFKTKFPQVYHQSGTSPTVEKGGQVVWHGAWALQAKHPLSVNIKGNMGLRVPHQSGTSPTGESNPVNTQHISSIQDRFPIFFSTSSPAWWPASCLAAPSTISTGFMVFTSENTWCWRTTSISCSKFAKTASLTFRLLAWRLHSAEAFPIFFAGLGMARQHWVWDRRVRSSKLGAKMLRRQRIRRKINSEAGRSLPLSMQSRTRTFQGWAKQSQACDYLMWGWRLTGDGVTIHWKRWLHSGAAVHLGANLRSANPLVGAISAPSICWSALSQSVGRRYLSSVTWSALSQLRRQSRLSPHLPSLIQVEAQTTAVPLGSSGLRPAIRSRQKISVALNPLGAVSASRIL